MPAYAQEAHDPHSHRAGKKPALGNVAFPNSGKPEAQQAFLTGLALLHSFEYDRAAEAFREATERDPRFAIAHWMEALTKSKVIWGLEDMAAARAILSRLAPTTEARLALARNRSERDFGSAVETLYADGELPARIGRFAAAMRRWAAAMPSHHEARTFASLAIIWQASLARGQAADSLNREAVAHAQFVFDRNPRHPGAAHYIIHASDAPAAAARGLRAAREYSRIAPDAEHALHMPSHIFLPLGLWEDMVASNERAWKASRSAQIRSNDPAWYTDWHSLNWLQYAYLQLGRWKDARALIDTARVLTSSIGGNTAAKSFPDGAFAAEQLAFRYATETGDWSVFAAGTTSIDITDRTISERARSMAATSLYQRGTLAALRGDSVTAVSVAASLRQVRPVMAAMIDITLLEHARDTAGMINALESLRPRSRVDRYSSMVPSPLRNADEMLGAALVASGRAMEAIAIYRDALKDRPHRAASLLGLARAQRAAGDDAAARATYDELAKIWRHADRDVAALIRRSGF